MSVRIISITMDNAHHVNAHEGIATLNWINEQTRASGNSTREQMVHFLENQGGVAYTNIAGRIAYLIVRISPYGNKYVKTIADGIESDNLLALPRV